MFIYTLRAANESLTEDPITHLGVITVGQGKEKEKEDRAAGPGVLIRVRFSPNHRRALEAMQYNLSYGLGRLELRGADVNRFRKEQSEKRAAAKKAAEEGGTEVESMEGRKAAEEGGTEVESMECKDGEPSVTHQDEEDGEQMEDEVVDHWEERIVPARGEDVTGKVTSGAITEPRQVDDMEVTEDKSHNGQ